MKYLQQFVTEFEYLMIDMKSTNHAIFFDQVNTHHVEDSIWAHTCMVFQQARQRNDEILDVTALFHDIGKCYCYEDKEDGKRRFSNHEGRSFFESLSCVSRMFNGDIEKTIKVLFNVANHGNLYRSKGLEDFKLKMSVFSKEYVTSLIAFVKCDFMGRITFDNKSFDLYNEVNNFYKEHDVVKTNVDYDRTMYVLIGLPGSGKSTFIQGTDCDVISRDEFIESMGEGDTYNEKFNNVDQEEVDKVFNRAYVDILRGDNDVIIDKTNLSKKSRRRFVADAKQRNMKKVAIISATSISECIERNTTRDGKNIPDYVISGMANRFTFPMGDEFDEVKIMINDKVYDM